MNTQIKTENSKLMKLVPCMLLVSALLFAGCGKDNADITIGSDSFNITGAAARMELDPATNALSVVDPSSNLLADVSEFKFCVKRVKLEGDDDQPVKKEGETGENGEKDPDDIKFAPGLIDVGSGTTKDWGTANIPVGFKLKRIKIKVHKDAALCGVNYSVRFNGQETDQDVEFKWRFDPPLELDAATGAVAVSMSSVVSALRSAADAGTLSSMKSHIENSEGSCRKK